ncbi:hypothetical protein [Cohnella cellulosilytica]|uniref:Uncharacterized protein n=1 Tax=Cohnella cellulosilytica TaxID=986710 RepID=A0ABW2FKK7_9BACL
MILFCEYVIPEQYREPFIAWADAHPELWRDAELAENTAQPGVFVELRRTKTEAEAAELEKERREGRSWQEMEQWVKGGRDGLRIWTFRQRLLPNGKV